MGLPLIELMFPLENPGGGEIGFLSEGPGGEIKSLAEGSYGPDGGDQISGSGLLNSDPPEAMFFLCKADGFCGVDAPAL